MKRLGHDNHQQLVTNLVAVCVLAVVHESNDILVVKPEAIVLVMVELLFAHIQGLVIVLVQLLKFFVPVVKTLVGLPTKNFNLIHVG